MGKRATSCVCLQALLRMALPLLKEAERQCPRTGPGAKPEIPDWLIGVLIMIAMLKRKKSKSAQYRFLASPENRRLIADAAGNRAFPSRSTFFRRYRRAHRLFQQAIAIQGEQAIAEGIVNPAWVAIDKSMIAALGPLWHKRDREADRIPPGLSGVDCESAWGYSKHDGWVQGYSFEIAVSATPGSVVFPLSASVAPASAKETQTVLPKLLELPQETTHVLVDSGYDGNEVAEKVEYDERDRPTGRKFLCPENRRGGKRRSDDPPPPRDESHRRRLQRRRFFKSRRGKTLYARRRKSVEPFNEWFKALFELNHHVWHRGLDNNRTQILAAIFCYQVLVRYNHRRGDKSARIKEWIDRL